MSIDARVQTVIINEDGSGELRLVDRPGRPGENPGCKGQPGLDFDEGPEEVTGLNGLDVWGGSSQLMLGERKIADRIGYTRIRFVGREEFKAALTEHHARRKAAVA